MIDAVSGFLVRCGQAAAYVGLYLWLGWPVVIAAVVAWPVAREFVAGPAGVAALDRLDPNFEAAVTAKRTRRITRWRRRWRAWWPT